MDEINILFIEDDPDSAELIGLALRSLPVPQRVQHFRRTNDAFAWLEGHASRLASNAFVLLEPCHASELDCALIVALRAVAGRRDLPIVVLVGSGDPFSTGAAYRCGVNSVVHKPFDLTELVSAVQQIAAYWLLRNISALERKG